MTHEKNIGSAHQTIHTDARIHSTESQYAPDEATTMSSHGQRENSLSSERKLRADRLVHADQDARQTSGIPFLPRPVHTFTTATNTDRDFPEPRPYKRMKIHFHDFAEQARLQQFYHSRQRRLLARRKALQKNIALSARLQRSTSWVYDGLVEMSKYSDAAGFARVFQYAQDLVDTCYAYWNQELRTLHTPPSTATSDNVQNGNTSFLDQLAGNMQKDFLDLVSTLRCDPRFLVERFGKLSASQVASLSRHPKWEEFPAEVLSTFSNDSGRYSQQRKRAQFSKSLEDYATSFERSNPLSFLLNNLFGTSQSADSKESQLRLSTWSTICAELFASGHEASRTLTGQVLDEFAMMYGWPAKDRLELFLMDHLQKGAPLLEASGFDPLGTDEASKFFEKAVRDLLFILSSNNGCYPTGALQLASSVMGKLSNSEQRSNFRQFFFYGWFLQYFLRIAISCPENEKMLLKVHISKQAREHLLTRLINQACEKVWDLRPWVPIEGDEASESVEIMVNALVESTEVVDPYKTNSQDSLRNQNNVKSNAPSLTLCAAEIVQLLEALSPQTITRDLQSMSAPLSFDPFPVFRDTRSTFQEQYLSASNRFDLLKAELLHRVVEPGSSTNDIHPCQERWLQLVVLDDGKLREIDDNTRPPMAETELNLEALDSAQLAALNLCTDLQDTRGIDLSTYLETHSHPPPTLTDLFAYRLDSSHAQSNPIDTLYWRKALQQLQTTYPLSSFTGNDTQVLQEPMRRLQHAQRQNVAMCTQLEKELVILERSSHQIKMQIERVKTCLEQLRLKMWYSLEVTHWLGYANARNVVSALMHMNLSQARKTTSIRSRSPIDYDRAFSSRSVVSSLFDQPRTDTISLLKAPAEHGGPKKLADSQIEKTRKWLEDNDIDNFCKGEERLHRFCMEVKNLARKLTGESITESPELWSSELFARESSLYDLQSITINSAPASTRPASVMSDTLVASSFMSHRPPLRAMESDNRSVISDEQRTSFRRSSIQSRISKDLLVPGLASSMGSHGKASSATTASASSIFSAPSRSLTSVSVYSRPSSIFNESRFTRFMGDPRQKREFLDKVQMGLVCLLLSDLGCLNWSWGSETDSWLNNHQCTAAITARLSKRLMLKELLGESKGKPNRRHSTQDRRNSISATSSPQVMLPQDDLPILFDESPETSFRLGLEDVLLRLSQHVDPIDKLQAVNDFNKLASLQMERERAEGLPPRQTRTSADQNNARRLSLDSQFRSSGLNTKHNQFDIDASSPESEPPESDFIRHIKQQLVQLKPMTLFRDLQYIAAFAPPEMLDKATSGKAFLQLGLAALDYKGELCQCMVDVADQIVTADAITRQSFKNSQEQPVSKAAEYLRIAALEGNATAQRELGMLYLMHPEILPIVSVPLAFSSEIFRNDRMWGPQVEGNSNRQALCLALHWMQQAAYNGDELAQRKLDERGE